MNDKDIIKRQQAEIERLKGECANCPMLEAKRKKESCLVEQIKGWQKGYSELKQELKTTKAEAIKEFAERLSEETEQNTFDNGYVYSGTLDVIIDNLVKEMVGDDNGNNTTI